MKNDQIQALREKSIDELEAEVAALRESLLKGRFTQAVENEPAGMAKRTARRGIARLLTIINEKKKAEVQA